jgi:hypothetical protein
MSNYFRIRRRRKTTERVGGTDKGEVEALI